MSRHVVIRVIVVLCASASVMLTASTMIAQSAQDKKTSPIGAWDVRGTDSDGTKWLGTLILTKGPEDATIESKHPPEPRLTGCLCSAGASGEDRILAEERTLGKLQMGSSTQALAFRRRVTLWSRET